MLARRITQSSARSLTAAALCLSLGLPLGPLPCAAQERPGPLAADLVEDGQQINLESERYAALLEELRTRHGFSQAELQHMFQGVSIVRRVLELMDRQAEAMPYYKYYPLFIKDSVIQEGRRQLEANRDLLAAIEKEFGVEREVVVAIWAVESRFGSVKSGYNLFRTLNTLFDAYPRRRDFYRQQLIEYLLLCRENGVDPLAVSGSYGGAFGQTQFIPSSFRQYAVDFDHDGKRDVWESVPDVLASIANYLHRHGWSLGTPTTAELGRELKSSVLSEAYGKGRSALLPWTEVKDLQQIDIPPAPGSQKLTVVGLELEEGGLRYVAGYPNFQAITKWNNSNRYAMAVTELAAKFKER